MSAPRNSSGYIPALRYERLTRFYDPLMRWTLRERTFKRHLLRNARIQSGQRVLDLGCGTATLALMIKRACPQAEVIGFDADAKALGIARAKAARAHLEVTLDQGLAGQLPYVDDSFDRVLSSLFFHHLRTEDKRRALREVFRVLRPGGELHVADWGKPQNTFLGAAFYLVRMLDGFENTEENAKGLLPGLFRDAGFVEVAEGARYATILGTLALYRARKPETIARTAHGETN